MAYHLTSLTIPYARDGHSRARAYEGIARAGFSHVGLYDGHEEGPVWPVGITASQARIAVQPALDAGLAIDHKSHGQVTDNPELFTQAIEFASEACVPSLVCWGPYEYEAGTSDESDEEGETDKLAVGGSAAFTQSRFYGRRGSNKDESVRTSMIRHDESEDRNDEREKKNDDAYDI